MSFYKVLVVTLLVVLIGITLFRNKKEIEADVALAEIEVEAWPVRVALVSQKSVRDSLSYSGVLQPSQELRIFSRSQGMVTRIYKQEGEKVKKGELIAKVDDTPFRNQLEVSDAVLKQSQADLERMRALSEGDAVTPQQLEQATLKVKAEESRNKELKRRIADTNLRAGLSGEIARLGFKEGEAVSPGQPLGLIADLGELSLDIAVKPAVASSLEEGHEVQVVLEDYPERVYEGAITRIATRADDGLKYKVEVAIKGTSGLLPGMFARVALLGGKEAHIVVPRETVLGGLDDPYVYVVSNDEKASQRQVKLGRIRGQYIEVRAGLREGEAVVISGHRNLKEGAKVAIRSDPS